MKVYLDQNFEESLSEIISQTGAKSIGLFTGKKSFEDSVANNYFNTLMECKVFRYYDFGKNPMYEDVLSVLNTLKSHEFDLVIAIGGGSVMDFGKLYAAFATNIDQFKADFTDVSKVQKLAPLVCIPTTSGSGSEATHFAVMYKDGQKYSVAGEQLTADYAIVDPPLSHTLPSYQTACSGMDALCQSIESFWAVGANSESRSHAEKALTYIIPNLVSAVLHPDDESRRQMALGSFYAGKAINISKTTVVHALAYYLTDTHDIPHGEAVGLNIDRFANLNISHLSEKLQEKLLKLFAVENISELVGELKRIRKAIGLKESIQQIENLDMDSYIESVNLERLTNNPVKMDKRSLKKVLSL